MFSYEIALNYWEVFLLILVRIASFVYTAPFFSMANTPQRVKLSLAIFISVMVFSLIPDRTLVYSGLLDYAVLLVKESVVGLLLGFCANICIQAISFAGHVIDVNIGLSMSTMYDPTMKEQISVSGTFYYYTVFLLMLITGLYQFLISAIVDSYTIIPLGKATVNATLYDSFLEMIADYFIMGFRIALPVFITLMILNVVLGVLTKVAPQLNMFAIGMQLKLLVGFAIMFITVFLLPDISSYLLSMMKTFVKTIAGGLT